MPITNISVTDTWRTWFNRVNEIIDTLNTKALVDGATAYGVFTLGAASNTSLSMVGSLLVNSSLINAIATTVFKANVTIDTTANVMNITSNKLLLQSPGGTIINSSPLTVNSNTIFTAPIVIQNNVTLQGVLNISGNLIISNAEIIAGALNIRNILFGQANAMFVPSALNSPQVNDYSPAGFDDASIVNLNPAVDVTLTGMQAPANIVVGGVIKYIQNIGSANKLTLVSNSASSSTFNRFKTPNDAPLDVLPGGAIVVIWTSSNKQWRVAGGGPSSSILNVTLQGLTNVAGNLAVTGISSFTGNSTFGATTLFVDTLNNRVGVKHTSPTQPLTVNGNVSIVGTLTQIGVSTLTGNTTQTGNLSIIGVGGANVMILTTQDLNAVFGNTINANSASQSFFRNLKANSFTSDGSATVANVTSTGKAVMSGTFVIPVGANKWAT